MPETSQFYNIVRRGCVDPKHLNAMDWGYLIGDCLKSCKSLLPRVALKEGKSFEDLLNYSIDSISKEKRITSKEIIDTLPKALMNNKDWLFIPVETLETNEEKGQFFERKLFIVADLACLMIMEVAFRKEPLPDQKMAMGVTPEINENVVACQIFINYKGLNLVPDGFSEKMLPYLEDHQRELGEKIVMHTLGEVIRVLQKIRESAQKTEQELVQFLEIRKRLGCDEF